jgi:hypothetical protein
MPQGYTPEKSLFVLVAIPASQVELICSINLREQ